MCLNEHSCLSSLCTSVLRAAGYSTTLFRTWQSVHKVIAVVCMLDETWVVVSRVVAAGNVAIVGGDMGVARGSSGCKGNGWGVGWGAVWQLGKVCCHLGGVGGRSGAGEGVVVAV
jgi:hypothetical protein